MSLIKTILYLLPAISFISSCGNSDTKKEEPLKKDTATKEVNEEIVTGFHNGDNCFEYYGLGGQGYMHMDIAGEDVTGTLYGYDDVWGNVYHEFKGVMQGDSIVVMLHEVPEDLELVWKIRIGSDGQIRIGGLPSNPGVLEINAINCQDLPDIEKDSYSSVEEIAKEEEAEFSENSSFDCFYKYYNTPGGRTTVSEYLKISFNDDGISGLGAGYREGEGEWGMEFNGSIANDTTFLIEATYMHTLNKKTQFQTSETWYINREHSRVSIKKISPNEFRQPGGTPFHRIDCADIDGWAVKRMKGE